MDPKESPPTIAFACVACGAKFRVAASFAGRKTKCTKCEASLTVPQPPSANADPFAHLVGFNCRLCGTRMSAPARNAGKKARCPDCEALTVIPAPEAPPAPNRPAAMDGEQYEVYEGEQPHGIDLARAEIPSVAFVCHVCQTHMTAEVTRVGEFVTCPDCRTETRVPAPPKKPRRKPKPNADEYAVEEAVVDDTTEKKNLYEEYAAKPPAGYRANEDEKSPRERRDEKPASTRGWGIGLFDGLIAAFANSSMVLAWFGLTFTLLFTAPMLGFTLGLLSQIGGGLGLIFGVLMLFTATAVTLIWVGVASSILWAVLDGAAGGGRRTVAWPSVDATEWMGPTLTLLFASVVSSIPGFVLAQALREQLRLPAPFDSTFAWVLAGMWLTLPWVLLSQLDNSSPWGIFSPRLVRTLRYAPVTWTTFYLVTLGLGACVYDLSRVTEEAMGLWAGLVTSPVEIASDLFAFWLLGRLAWVAGSKTPEVEPPMNAD